MGSVVKSVGSALGFGGGGGAGPKLNDGKFDYSKQVQDRVKQSRDASMGLMTQLQQQSQGQGPSLADAQMKSAANRSLAQQMAMAASGRGGNAALRQRQAMAGGAQTGREIAEASGIARLQEQQQAQNMLMNLSQQQQGQDLQQIMQPAQGVMEGEKSRFAADVARRNAVQEQQGGMLGGLLGAGAQLGAAYLTGGASAALSDEREKKNVKSGSKSVSEFLDKLSSKNYEYKDTSKPGTAPGNRVGVMAQDLEKSDMGKTLVKDTPQGKMVDTQQGFGAILAAQSELNERLKKLEGKKRG